MFRAFRQYVGNDRRVKKRLFIAQFSRLTKNAYTKGIRIEEKRILPSTTEKNRFKKEKT